MLNTGLCLPFSRFAFGRVSRSQFGLIVRRSEAIGERFNEEQFKTKHSQTERASNLISRATKRFGFAAS